MLQTCDVHCCVSVQENGIKTILQKKKCRVKSVSYTVRKLYVYFPIKLFTVFYR